jgi:hypothetical protein
MLPFWVSGCLDRLAIREAARTIGAGVAESKEEPETRHKKHHLSVTGRLSMIDRRPGMALRGAAG